MLNKELIQAVLINSRQSLSFKLEHGSKRRSINLLITKATRHPASALFYLPSLFRHLLSLETISKFLDAWPAFILRSRAHFSIDFYLRPALSNPLKPSNRVFRGRNRSKAFLSMEHRFFRSSVCLRNEFSRVPSSFVRG